MAIITPVARVSAIQGQAFAKGRDGALRVLHVGDPVFDADRVIAAEGSRVDLAADDGRNVIVRASETLTVDAEVMASVPPDASDSALLATGADTGRVIRAISEGRSLDTLLEETAAGESAGSADGGPTFVRLLRITEGVAPLDFEFDTTRPVIVDDASSGGSGALSNARLNDSVSGEPVETVPPRVGGQNVTGGSTDVSGAPSTGPVNANPAPSIGAIDVGDVSEGNALVYTVSVNVNGTALTPTTFTFNLGGGSATAGADYTDAPVFSAGVSYDAVAHTITLAPGVTRFTVTVPTLTDAVSGEAVEGVPLSIGGQSASGGILDVSSAPNIGRIEAGSVGPAGDNVSEGNALVYTVSVNGTALTPTTFAFNLGGGGSATAGADYTDAPVFSAGVSYDPVAHTITLDPGITSFTVTVPTLNDAVSGELLETVPLSIGGQSASGGIIDVTPVNVTLTATTTSLATTSSGLLAEYYGYNDSAHSGYKVHADDTTRGNLDSIADMQAIINGRNGNIAVVGSITAAGGNAPDAVFRATDLNYGYINGDLGSNTSTSSGKLATFLHADAASLTGTVGRTTDAGIRFIGYLDSPAGSYDIRINSDDGFRLMIDGTVVSAFDSIRSPGNSWVTNVSLSGGLTPIEILYWDQAGEAILRIEFKPAGAPDSAYMDIGTGDLALVTPTGAPVLTPLQDIIADPAHAGQYLIQKGQEYTGTLGGDQLTGSVGRDIIHGGAGNDTINGRANDDTIDGGTGHDTLTGGLGSDVFAWHFGDQGVAGSPATDMITDFSLSIASGSKDVLNLKDLLQGETHPLTSLGTGNLTDYLHFEKQGADTVIHVSSAGGFSTDAHAVGATYSSGHEDQTIVLQNVDLAGANTTDLQIIQDLLTKGKLITD